MAHLTIPAGEPWVSYTPGGSSTGPFNVTFPIFSTSDLNVMVNGVLLSPSDWTFTSTDARTGGDQAGYVTLNSATTSVVVIYRDTTRSRTSDYSSGPLDMDALNSDVDRTVARDQELRMRLDRTLRQPLSDAAAMAAIPAKASRASAYLAFNANGDPVAITSSVSGTPVSAFMATVLDDPDGATALATLGAQPLDADLTAIAGLGYTSGQYLPRKTAANAWSLVSLGAASGDAVPLLNSTINRWGGTNDNIDSAAPGATLVSYTDTSNTAASGTKYLQQNYLGVAPTGTSTGDHRAAYFRTDIKVNQTIAKAIAASGYLYLTASGALLTTGYGVTGQIIITNGASLTSGSGVLGTVRAENASAFVTQGKGVQGLVTSNRASGTAVSEGAGVFGGIENQAGGTHTNVSAFQAELRNSSSGAMTTGRLFRGDALNLSTGTATTWYGWYSALTNNGGGSIGTWAHAYYAPRTGSAPSTERVILSDDTADSVFAGLLQAASFKGPQNGRLRPLTATVADDAATSFTIVTGTSGFVMFSIGQSNSGCIAIWDSVGSYSIAAMVESETYCVIDYTTGALTGTTGVDNRITISIHTDNRIYVENRSGGSITFVILIIDRTA